MTNPVARLRPGPLDIHTHVAPAAFLSRVASGERAGFGLETDPNGTRRMTIGGQTLRGPIMPGMDSLEIRLKTMEEQGVSSQLVSPWIALANYKIGEADGVWFAEVLNEGIADFVRANPDRFIGVGSVPLQFPERAAEMLRVVMGELGLLGVEINTTINPERFLDDPTLDPFWAVAEELGALIMIHPSLGGTGKQFANYYLNNLVHNPLETTVAAAHLIFGGVMERFPRLKIYLVHGGGFLPYNLGRLRRGRLVREEAKVSMSGSVEESFSRFVYDTVTHSHSALKFLVSEVGAEKVMLGSDYPFDMGDPDLVGTVKRAELGDEAETLVLRGSAEQILAR